MLKLISLCWILSTNDQVVLAIFFAKKEWIGIFVLPKNENWHDIKIGKNTKNAILVNLF